MYLEWRIQALRIEVESVAQRYSLLRGAVQDYFASLSDDELARIPAGLRGMVR